MATPAPVTEERDSLGQRIWAWTSEQGLVTIAIILFLLAWEYITKWRGVPVFVLPPPSIILAKMITEWRMLGDHSLVTTQEVLLGFGLSVAVGIPLAIGIVYSRVFERVAFTFLVSLQTVPKVALAPILVIWFGYGLMPKVLVAFLISFFPIVISAVVGMRSVEREMIYLVQSMGAGELKTFLKIRLPKALPSIFGGLKVGMGQAVIGAVVGEYIAAEKGLGYLQLIAQVRLDTPLIFAAVVTLSLLGVVLFNIVAVVERLVIPWHKQITERTE